MLGTLVIQSCGAETPECGPHMQAPTILADPKRLRPTCHQVLSLALGVAAWVVGEGTEERWRKRGNWWKSRVVSQLIGDALPGLQCLPVPSWLPDAIMNCTDTVGLWILASGCRAQPSTGPLGVRSAICQCYTTPALWLWTWDVWVGGQGIAYCLLSVVE